MDAWKSEVILVAEFPVQEHVVGNRQRQILDWTVFGTASGAVAHRDQWKKRPSMVYAAVDVYENH